MSDTLPLCPGCSSEHAYEMGALLVCPMCGHEWSPSDAASDDAPVERVVRDAVGNVLADGDTVVVTTGIKVKGSPQGIKQGAKVRGIRLIDPVNGHDIDGRVDGFGAMLLKSGLVKKA
ncbi:zinc ribbon domain-containing protein YjdM [Microbacterium resistens]|uniref:Alkylphosphonate utilization protein n=1 Tax=Microbacterium resistens TaxID=156977 RepID=A0ABY3RSE3_9MICO|nr:zinc ribbon domain-containing protein YjdM [Microbacterium resistens]MBW1640691.1 alkylphosphonate utilization protein [Microbacterium resistens]UGS25417.1 alkylphosphonate utilization protein [Microbacterium resistens]